MKIRFFKLDKNKKYNYTPRFYQGKDLGNPFEFDERLRKYRETPNNTAGMQWNEARRQSRNRSNKEINKTLVITFLILLFIALYILDFDLSIFLKK